MEYYQRNNIFSNIPEVTRNLLAINVMVFIAILINQNAMVERFALFFPASRFFKPWQLLTHLFMHGSFWHIFFNMYSLFLFGSVVERSIGTKRFLTFYFVCGLGAALLHMGVQGIEYYTYLHAGNYGAAQALNYVPTVGASGAIYGVLIAYAMLYPSSRLTLIFPPVTMSARTMVIVFAVIELLTGMGGTTDGVAHFAHLGGMLAGWLLIRWWKKRGDIYTRY